MENKYLQKEIVWLLREKYGGFLGKEAEEDIKKLKRGEPVDYLIGFFDFLGNRIDLSLEPLIPRSETEFWVERAIEQLKNCQIGQLSVLDIFSGSGCIGIAVLKNIRNVKVVFAESEKKFLKQIEINADLNEIDKKRYKIIQSDIFRNVKGKYDYIFANPPYIAKTKKNLVQKSVLNFEPKVALFGGNDGFLYIKKFLKGARDHLNKGGKIYMEFDSWQKSRIEEILKHSGYRNCQFNKDQYGKWRYLIASQFL